MGRNFTAEALAQLSYGRGQTLAGDAALILLKALLESGVAYLGGYPGAPTSGLYDAAADAYEPVLRGLGIHLETSGNEASAAAMLFASVNHPIRGAVNWKVVGNNVAADPLAHVAAAGVMGGALIFVGEDYGLNSTTVAERTLPYAYKSALLCIDPLADAETLARLVREGFKLSEASHMPALYLLRTRVGNLKGAVVCQDNHPPEVSLTRPLEHLALDPSRVPLMPAFALDQEREKFAKRIPAAQRYILEHGLNQATPGDGADAALITHGAVYNTTLRVLHTLGEADLCGRSRLSILALNVIHPLVPEEVAAFLRRSRRVLVVEEGMPNLLESSVRAIVQAEGLSWCQVHGKDLLPQAGEYTPQVLIGGLAQFLARKVYPTNLRRDEVERRAQRAAESARAGSALLTQPLPARTATFCTGCPERPVFSALKLTLGPHPQPLYAADSGCYVMGCLPPFRFGDTYTGMGTGLANVAALSRLSRQQVVAFMGDGTFWHSGLTSSIASAVHNNQEGILLLFENGWTSMTGQQANPSTHYNARGEATPPMSIEGVLKGLGVPWVRVVNPHRLRALLRVLCAALRARRSGLKVVVCQAECQLERQRRLREEARVALERGKPVQRVMFRVDGELCAADHSCIRHNGCPSLTVERSANPLREASAATILPSCVGCGLCGDLAQVGSLCPAFYRVTVTTNPGPATRALDAARWFLVRHLLQRDL